MMLVDQTGRYCWDCVAGGARRVNGIALSRVRADSDEWMPERGSASAQPGRPATHSLLRAEEGLHRKDRGVYRLCHPVPIYR